MDCAREILGTASSASAVRPRAASESSNSGRSAGDIRLMTVVPGSIRAISSSVGALTFMTMSDAHAFFVSETTAPAAVYWESGNDDAAPAPRSTTIS